MKVLVTGSSGFIGNYVVKELLKRNNSVIATSTDKEKIRKMEWYNDVEYISCDLKTHKDFYTYFNCPEVLIHLAWEGLPNYKSVTHIENNLLDNFFFLKKMIASGLTDILVTGTCLEYGLVNGCLDETLVTNPQNPYAIAKDTLRKFLELLKYEYHFNFNWLRIFYVYGEGQNATALIPQLEKSIKEGKKVFNMSGGEQIRDFIHVNKVAEIIVKIALSKKEGGIINCCSGEPITVRKFVEDYLHEFKKEIKLNLGYYPYNDYEPFAFWGSNKKLMNFLKENMDE